MKKFWRLPLIVFCTFLLLAAIITGLALHHREKQRIAGEELYAQMHSAFAAYPQLPETYGYTEFYYNDGTTEYLLLRNGEKQITATRDIEGKVVYYMSGKTWLLDDQSTLMETGVAEDPVEEVAAKIVRSLLGEQDVTYTYDIAEGTSLPCFVFSGAPYLECQRPSHPGYYEFMSCGEDDNGEFITWDIIQTADDVTLYIFVRGFFQDRPEYGYGSIPGWWEVADGVSEVLFK